MSMSLEPNAIGERDAKRWLSRLRNMNPFQSSYWALYKTLDDYQSKTLLAVGLLSATAAGVPLPLIAVTFREIIDSFPPEEHSLDQAVYTIVGISFAYFTITFVWTVTWGELGRRISQKLQKRLVQKVFGLDQTFFDIDPCDITSVLVSDTETIQRGTSEKVGLFIQSCSYFVATFTTGFVLNASLTGVLFAAIFPTIVLITWTGSSLIATYSNRSSRFLDQAASIAEGAIRCSLVVQAFDVTDHLSNKHAHLLRTATHYAVRKVIVGALMLACVYWACYSLNALAFYWGSRLGGSSGTIYAVVFLILDASFVVNQVGPFIQTIALAAGASTKVCALLKRADSHISAYSDEGNRPNCYDVCQDIQLHEVEFIYPARPTHKVLGPVSMTIPGGRSTAVVGLSGSGKSTIVSLLTRLYDPRQGVITVGGRNIRDLHLATFRSHIAVVQQSPVIFSGTILDNISCGIVDDGDLEDEVIRARCMKAASDAHCDFVQDLQYGIDTFVSSSQGLSGGQRQRICLARALVRKPALLILDEPTSALDSWSEQKIEESLSSLRMKSDTTVVTVAHRLATVKDYSNIVVMGEGRLLEQGSHDDLLEKGTHYKALVDAQEMEGIVEHETSRVMSLAERHPNPTSTPSRSPSLDVMTGPILEQQSISNKSNPPLSDFQLLKHCFNYLRPQRGLLFVGIAAAVIQGAIVVGEAIVFGHLVSVINQTSDRSQLYDRVDFYCLMFFVIGLVALLASALNGICLGFVSEAFVLRMRDVSLRTILIQDQAWFQEPEHTTTKLIAGINQNSNSVAAVSGPILQTLFATLSMIISGIILALVSIPLITVVAMSYIPAIVLSGYVRMKMLSEFNQRYSTANKDAAAIACEGVQSISTVAAFGLERKFLQRYSLALDASRRCNFVVMCVGNLALSFSYSVIYFLYPLLYWWGSRQVREGRYSQEQFFISLPAVVIASQQCGQFFTMAPEITSARLAARQILRLLGSKPSIMAPTRSSFPTATVRGVLEKSLATSLPLRFKPFEPRPGTIFGNFSQSSATVAEKSYATGAEIVFKDVSFAYPTRPDARALQKINLRIQPGQFVAFVGPSGAGKSSLIALLERFFDPLAGDILVDGQSIRLVPIESHRAKLGLVPQEPELFAGSIAFNISLGARPGENISQTDIEIVCKACGIHDLISHLPDGYDTECGSQGSKLSGGQKQRIAVARALVRNPRILLLDEATASLDSQSEKDIQSAVNAASSNRTTIVVAHRLSTIQHADCIFVLDNGVLVDQGRHTDLVAKGGLYSSMVRAQGLA